MRFFIFILNRYIFRKNLESARMPVENITYGDKYQDEKYEYRNVTLPPDLAKLVPRNHLMTETEWRNMGVQQSPGRWPQSPVSENID